MITIVIIIIIIVSAASTRRRASSPGASRRSGPPGPRKVWAIRATGHGAETLELLTRRAYPQSASRAISVFRGPAPGNLPATA